MNISDIKLGIDINGLDETLKRLCDIVNDTHADYAKALNLYNSEMHSHIATKVELCNANRQLNTFKIKNK